MTNPSASRASFKRRLFRWIKVLLLLYASIGIALFYLQETLIFRPKPLPRGYDYHFDQPYTELNIPYDRETNLNVIRFNAVADSIPRGVVLYFHGNKENISHYAAYARNFTDKGYEVWMMDYPGYGKSTGVLTEKNLYTYALVLYKLARSRFKPGQIVIYGKSLGTGIAAELANARDCRRLILESPYYSLISVAKHYFPVYPVNTMLHYRFPTNEYLPGVDAPVTIFHGTDDGLIPFSNATRLRSLLKPGDEFIPIEGGSHNDLNSFPMFHHKLDSVLRR